MSPPKRQYYTHDGIGGQGKGGLLNTSLLAEPSLLKFPASRVQKNTYGGLFGVVEWSSDFQTDVGQY